MKTSLKLSAYGAALAVLVAGTYFVGTAVGPTSESSPPPSAPRPNTPTTDMRRPRSRTTPAASRRRATATRSSPSPHAGLGHLRLPDHRPRRLPGHRLRRGPRPAAAPGRRAPRRHGLPARAPRARRRGYLAGAADRPGRGRLPGVRRLHPDRRPGRPRSASTCSRPATSSRSRTPPSAHHHRRRPHRHPRRRPHGRRRVAARLTVSRDGAPVAVQPYLGAFGHLVALREGDLAYLHVHPAQRRRARARGRVRRRGAQRRAPTGCSSTSRSTASCAPPTSRW